MSVFELSNYLSKEDREKNEAKLAANEKASLDRDRKQYSREIQLLDVSKGRGSEIVSRALRDALKRDDIDFFQLNGGSDHIFKDVKVLTDDDISRDIGSAKSFVMEGSEDVILMLSNPDSLTNKAFISSLGDREGVYQGVDSFLKESDILSIEESVVVTDDDIVGVVGRVIGIREYVKCDTDEVLYEDNYMSLVRKKHDNGNVYYLSVMSEITGE